MLFSLQEPIFKQTDKSSNYEASQVTAPTLVSLEVLRQKLPSLLKEGYPSIHQMSKAAGMSLRSFQRQLAQDNLNYSDLVEQVRYETAVCLLQDPTVKLIEIALDLGYADAANFTRAFKRWTGMSPSQFRHLHTNF
jgi:AraC-like DNA-binding protein